MSTSSQTSSAEQLLWWLLVGTRGGETRAMIVKALDSIPRNANQIAVSLKLNYKTVRHHLQILKKNGIITSTVNGHARDYSISSKLSESYRLFKDNEKWTSSPGNHQAPHQS